MRKKDTDARSEWFPGEKGIETLDLIRQFVDNRSHI